MSLSSIHPPDSVWMLRVSARLIQRKGSKPASMRVEAGGGEEWRREEREEEGITVQRRRG